MPPKKDKYGKIPRSKEGMEMRAREGYIFSTWDEDGTPLIVDGVIVKEVPKPEAKKEEK